jgi:hypothetical protein
MSHTSRPGDPPDAVHFRSDRVVHVNDAWFIATREGIDVGPYPTPEAAASAVGELAEILGVLADGELARTFVREFQRRHVDAPPG